VWIVLDRADGSFRGVAGLRDTPGARPELLYSIAPAYWAQGLATEAGRAVLDHAFVTLGLETVSAATDRPNAASRRVLDKLGFARTGEALLHGLPIVQYVVTRERFFAARSPEGRP
jgi:RimJ/RimL family protein N-acetyltransferase